MPPRADDRLWAGNRAFFSAPFCAVSSLVVKPLPSCKFWKSSRLEGILDGFQRYPSQLGRPSAVSLPNKWTLC